MILRLENTNYQDFDAWLRLRADKYGFLVSYDEAGLRENKKDLKFIPQEIYPLRIFLSKLSQHGTAFDYDAVIIAEKSGLDLVISPKPFSERGKDNIQEILIELADHWPSLKKRIFDEIGFQIQITAAGGSGDQLQPALVGDDLLIDDPDIDLNHTAKKYRVWPTTLKRWRKVYPLQNRLTISQIAERLDEPESNIKRDIRLMRKGGYQGE